MTGIKLLQILTIITFQQNQKKTSPVKTATTWSKAMKFKKTLKKKRHQIITYLVIQSAQAMAVLQHLRIY